MGGGCDHARVDAVVAASIPSVRSSTARQVIAQCDVHKQKQRTQHRASKEVCHGGRTTIAVPSSRYNDFLFSVICEEANGTQLSVLSALTRVDVDPWEEAARLSVMTEPIARSRLISMLNQTPGSSWSPSQKAAIATRLIGRLPSTSDNSRSALSHLS